MKIIPAIFLTFFIGQTSSTYVWPNAGNTGYGSTSLTNNPGSNVISTPGTYNALRFNGAVTIQANNVTIQNCQVNMGNSDLYAVRIPSTQSNIVIQNCQIVGPGNSSTQGGSFYGILSDSDTNLTIYKNDICCVSAGVEVSGGQTVVNYNYIHDLSDGGHGAHVDGTFYGGAGGSDFSFLIENNYIYNPLNQTDAVFIQNTQSGGPASNVTVDHNYLWLQCPSSLGCYSNYQDGSKTTQPMLNIIWSNNFIKRGSVNWNGYWYFNQGSLSNANYQACFSGNVDADSLANIDPYEGCGTP